MAGFFDRMKERFTQYAAGTTDLSGLSEDQQKLLRRQAIGRLGASLYRDGDFGAAMAQQEEINAKRNAEQAALAQRKQIAEILSPQQQALVGQAPSVAAPQAPTLLRAPGSAGAPGAYGSQDRVPQPSASAQPGQQPTPQQAGALAQEAGAQRARYQRLAEFYHAQGNVEGAKSAIDMANAFAAREEYFTPMAAMVDGREVLIQGSKSGNVNVLGATPTYTDTVRTAIQFGQEPEAFARHLQSKNAGANRTLIQGPDAARAAMVKHDAKRLDAIRAEASQAVAALPGFRSAYEALNSTDTGALQNALVPLIRFVNPGADIAQAQTIAAAGMTPMLLAQLAGIGGSDTVREVELMLANLPSTANPQETNRKLFEVIISGIERKISDARNAEQLFYDQGGSLRGFESRGNVDFDIFRNQFQQDGARAGGAPSRRAAWGLE